MSQTNGGRKVLETAITAFSVLGAIYLIFEHIAKFLWSLKAESFFGIAKYHFYDNLLANSLVMVGYFIILASTILLPFLIKTTFPNLPKYEVILILVYQFMFLYFSLMMILLNGLPFIFNTLSLEWSDNYLTIIYILVFVGSLWYSFSSYSFIAPSVNSVIIPSLKILRIPLKECLKWIIFYIFLVIYIGMLATQILSPFFSSPSEPKQYEIAYHDNKSYVIVPQTATDSLFIEATVLEVEQNNILAFEKGAYQIMDKSTVEKIEYRYFDKVVNQLNKDNRYQLTKENNQLWLTFPLGEEEIKKEVVDTNGIKQAKFNNLRYQILPSISGDSYILIFDDKELKQVVYSDNLSIPEQSETSSKLSQTSAVKSSSTK